MNLLSSHQSIKHPAGYVGRFAPSPSGQLHFGSMVAAVASFLQARANNGQWLVRIEDIDPPRQVKGADTDILNTLEQHGLHWDQTVLYQSSRTEAYRALLEQLAASDRTYLCQCTRKQTHQMVNTGGIYPRTCRDLKLNQANCAVRFKNDQPILGFEDRIQGWIGTTAETHSGAIADDFIIHRKDGLFAYQLAVVADDIEQGITEVVRGCDLLSVTLHQMTLFAALGQQPIHYAHVPVAVTSAGHKLSKQNHAKPVAPDQCQQTLIAVCDFLGIHGGQQLVGSSVAEILAWATAQWRLTNIAKVTEQLVLKKTQ